MSGLYNEAPSGVWKWVDGTALTDRQGAGWDTGRVRNLRGYGNCVGISSRSGWSNTDCNQNFSYVCEIQESKWLFRREAQSCTLFVREVS